MDELIKMLLGYAISGLMLFLGVFLGSRLSARSMIKEVDKYMEQSETFQAVKKTLTDQTLIEKATVFFEEATKFVTSPEAKNFFEYATAALKEFSSAEPQTRLRIPEKPTGKPKTDN